MTQATEAKVERVGYVLRELAEELGLLTHGFSALTSIDHLHQLETQLKFVNRPEAEQDPSRKQIIPYGIVSRGSDVFVVERLTGGGEARLYGKLSIGIGGHINPDRTETDDGVILAALRRELDEELFIEGISDITAVGFINDDTQPVGQVHLGVAFHILLTPNGSARVREVDALSGRFHPWSELSVMKSRMETWSAFVLDAFTQGSFQ